MTRQRLQQIYSTASKVFRFSFLSDLERRVNLVGGLLLLGGTLLASFSVYGLLQWQEASRLSQVLQETLHAKEALFQVQVNRQTGDTIEVANDMAAIQALQGLRATPGDSPA